MPIEENQSEVEVCKILVQEVDTVDKSYRYKSHDHSITIVFFFGVSSVERVNYK